MAKLVKTKSKNSNPLAYALIFAGIISLYFHRKTADPFNAPKLWLLIVSSAWISGYLLNFRKKNETLRTNNQKILNYLLVAFQLAAMWALINSDVKITAFFGENMRKIGFVTYFCFSVFMYFSAKYSIIEQYKKFYMYSSVTGLLFLFYGILQASGNDFVKWVNPYNSIIGTLGNPNFAAAFLALFAVLFFSISFIKEFNLIIRYLCGLTSGVFIYCIQLSDARQGILAAAVGLGFFVCTLVYLRNRIFGLLLIVFSLILSTFVVLAMLQKGPLQDLIYKDSVSIRGYYWRAGINMFKDNFFTGVGLDRYGAYFKEFQDLNYGLKIGFDITSTNAHNIPIQIFATGGIFLGLTYLLLMLFIFYTGLKSIRKFEGDHRVYFLALFSAWLTYQAQSIVSIENIGLGIWGWILGGMIIGLSDRSSDVNLEINTRTSKSVSIQPILSFLVLIPTIVIVSKLVSVDNTMYQAQINYNPENPETLVYAKKVLDTQFMDNEYKYSAANMMLRANGVDQGIVALQDLMKSDPRNTYYMLALAQALEYQTRNNESIIVREKITTVDPHNVKNYLQLGRLYKLSGDFYRADQMRQKLISLAPNTEQAKAAQVELVIPQ
jgi:O-antigen ligase